jgi:ADP-heptose:LPS heptosyltransferase
MGRSSDLTRNLDGIAGRLAATFLPRRFRPMPAAPRRIVLLQPTAIGDTLIASGAVAAIARRFPDAELLIAHGANNAAAVKMLTAPLRPVQIDFSNPVKAVWALRALKPEMVVDLTPWPYATALSARLTGAWSAGFAPTFGQRGRLFDLAVPHRTDRHELDNLEAMARALGVAGDCGMAIRRDSAALLEELNPKDLVLCHVSAGGARAAAKAWPCHAPLAFAAGSRSPAWRSYWPWRRFLSRSILACCTSRRR